MTSIAPPPRGYVLAADHGLAPDRPDLKASAGSTGGPLTVFTLSVDGGPPRHTHTREDESIYLFSGRLEVECGGEELRRRVANRDGVARNRGRDDLCRTARRRGDSSVPGCGGRALVSGAVVRARRHRERARGDPRKR